MKRRARGIAHSGHLRYIDERGRVHADPGLWYRLLDTVIIGRDDVPETLKETVGDHGSENYVALLARAAGKVS